LKRKLSLIAALAALLAVPGSALAQDPANDHYLGPFLMNDGSFDNPAPFPERPTIPGFTVDTTNATTQADLFNPPGSGGPVEPTQCGPSPYGKTHWSVFWAHRYGRMEVSTGGAFDAVIAVIPFNDPSTDPTPRPDLGLCVDRLSGFTEDFGNSPPIIVRGGWYAVQVGGYQDPATGAVGAGPVETKFEFFPPARISGDAILRGGGASGGIRVSELEVTAARGSRIRACAGGCKSVAAKAGSRTLLGPIGKVSPADEPVNARMKGAGAGAPKGAPLAQVAAAAKAGPLARTARTRTFFRGKRVSAGRTIKVYITRPGYIGRYFSWKVRSGGVGNKVQRCLEPFSNRPRTRCDG
jgi:hypothetical protein